MPPFIKLVRSYAHLLWELLRVVDVHCLAPGVGYRLADKNYLSFDKIFVIKVKDKHDPDVRKLIEVL